MNQKVSSLFFMFFMVASVAQALPANYQSLKAEAKQELLWKNISQAPYPVLPQIGSALFLQFLGSPSILTLNTTLDRESDELPLGRLKFIHTLGSCATFQFEPKANEFSGLFQSGAQGILRMGWAASPELLGYIPGVSLKFLIDGKPSVNVLTGYSLDGQGSDSNFFSHELSNRLPDPQNPLIQVLLQIFKLASRNPLYLPLDHLAERDSAGVRAEEVLYPEEIILSSPLKKQFSKLGDQDLRLKLKNLKAGQVLFNVYAQTEGNRQALGQIKLTSDVVESLYCDQKLFFRHHSVEAQRH